MAGKPARKSNKRHIIAVERRAEALRLRKMGLTFEEIAKKLGVARKTAWECVQHALREMLEEPAEEVRKLELARLDDYLIVLNNEISKGKTGKIDTALKVLQRRAALLGLDQPLKIEAVTRTPEELIPRVADMLKRRPEVWEQLKAEVEGYAAKQLPPPKDD